MTLLDRLIPAPRRVLPAAGRATKAVTGAGAAAYYNGVPIAVYQTDDLSKTKNALAMMRKAQDAYIQNRHIRKAERAITQRFQTIKWHLEDPEGIEVGELEGQNDDPAYLEVKNLLERPYVPKLGEPATASPRTWSGLAGLTCRHKGICGMGYWFLDQTDAASHTPMQILYINPSRLTPVQNKGQLQGWVLDGEEMGYGGRPTGIPLDIEDVIPFYLEPPDYGFLGVGLVASALGLVELTRTTDIHSTGVLSTGGRLAGIVSPKGEDIIPPDIYEQMKNDLRNIAEDPQAAKRMAVLRAPVQFDRTSATPSELELTSLMKITADEVSTLWGVPPSQLGAPTPAGLNSGDTKSFDEAVMWQGPIAGRLSPFQETIQLELLDRWKTRGVDVTIIFEPPEFDDETPAYQRAGSAESQPLSNKERREIIGKDPFGDERDDEVWLPSSLVRVWPPAPEAPSASQNPPGGPEPAEVEDVFADDSLGVGDLLAEDDEEPVPVGG